MRYTQGGQEPSARRNASANPPMTCSTAAAFAPWAWRRSLAKAGVTKPSLYRSFLSKDELAADYLRHMSEDGLARFSTTPPLPLIRPIRAASCASG